jgi:hypothetical protein
MRLPKHRVYPQAANLFFVLHCAFSLFVTFGAFLTVVDRVWIWIHVPAVLWTFSMNVANWTCPLTTWEDHFRNRAARPASGGFISHYLGPLLPANAEPRRVEIGISVFLFVWNLLLYAVLWGAPVEFAGRAQ